MDNVISQDRKHANNEVCTCIFRLPYKDLPAAACVDGDVGSVVGVVLVVSEGGEGVGVPTGEKDSRDHHQTYL